MYRSSCLAACLLAAVTCFVGSLRAELPPERRADATYVLTGTVDRVYHHTTNHYRHYIIRIWVERVDRGKGVKPDEIFYASCFQRRADAPPQAAPRGHRAIPREGQKIKAYVNDRGGENAGVYPNWFDVLEQAPAGSSEPEVQPAPPERQRPDRPFRRRR